MKVWRKGIRLAPTDLSNFLNCRHLSALDRMAALGVIDRPVRSGPMLDELKERGLAHETRFAEYLEATGRDVVRITEEGDKVAETAAERTLEVMRSGADVIYQGTLADGTWSGRPDFLIRVNRPSALGDWSYEVTDTKLARETRAGTVLQLCVYSYLLGAAQGARPEWMYVITPGNDFAPVTYRLDDYAAYVRLLESGLSDFIDAPQETYPELVSHCDLCAWWGECEARRRDDDHLCYVAGISSGQIKSLRSFGINCLADLAAMEEVPKPPQGSQQALVKVREQARVQVIGRDRQAPYHKLLEPLDAEHGLALLPEPTPDDIFLDFEGNHFTEEGGVQEYLTGFLARDETGERTYHALWANTLEEEREAFERFMDFASATRRRNPQAHIYHFAPYEPAALKRLMGRFATCEIELDELLRGEAFVDLHKLVKRSLMASVERYSIKDLEPFFGYARGQNLRDAAMSRRVVEHAIEAGENDAIVIAHREIVEDYNREDCESAERLRDWLERLREEAVAAGHELVRPSLEEAEASEEISELDQELARLRDGLLAHVAIDPADRSEEEQARFILAHMMEFHRREDKAGWWEYFRLLDLDPEDHLDERRAVTGLMLADKLNHARAPVHRYGFPSQEIDAREGDTVYDTDGATIGSVRSVDCAGRILDIKKRVKSADIHPTAVVLHKRIDPKPLRESLMRLGESVLSNGFSHQEAYQAAFELLLRRPIPLLGANGELQQAGETTLQAACRLACQLDHHVLAIQGPPGTGKTYTGAHIICALKEAGLTVGVTAVSHAVIENLMEKAMEVANDRGIELRASLYRSSDYEGPWNIERELSCRDLELGLRNGAIDVAGGSAWCWSREQMEQCVDVLIVDEAGQMALSNVLSTSPAGRGLILLGDPQQLEQPLQSSHPEGSEVSALYHLLGGAKTMPSDKGLFLAETWRLHPEIARFTSEAYYEGRVAPRPGLETQAILARQGKAIALQGSGLRFMPVDHQGNTARSSEEANAIANLVTSFLDKGAWRDEESTVASLTADDIRIVAPYNAQVAALQEAMPEMRGRIGTVDKFQGQEAPIVIYSMTSSSPEEAPRGMDFLYDPHRFNVATSRARALCVLVGSPQLFNPECKTPQQMRRANGFCRYLEVCKRS